MASPSLRPSRRLSAIPAAAVVLGLTLGLTGCGDDKKADDTATTTTVAKLTAAALREQADAICAEVSTDSKALPDPEELADVETMATDLVEISEKGLEGLKALEPSADDEKVMTELIGLIEDSNSSLEAAAAAAKDDDEDKVTESLDASGEKLGEFSDVAKDAGFDDCGKVAPSESTTDDPTDDPAEEPTDGAALPDIDLGQELNEIPGFTYSPLPDDARAELVDGLSADPAVTDIVAAVGTTTVTDANGVSILIFLALGRELTEDETTELVNGVVEDGTDLQQGDVAGQTGYTFTTTDGQLGFVTVRSQTLIIGISDSADHLGAVVTGLFEANPDL